MVYKEIMKLVNRKYTKNEIMKLTLKEIIINEANGKFGDSEN